MKLVPSEVNESVLSILGEDYLRPPGKTIYPEVFETPLMFPLQRQRELEEMMIIAQQAKPETVFEIGTDKGGGLYHWIKCQPTVKNVIACEIRGIPYKALFEEAYPHLNFLWLDSVSSFDPKTISKVTKWLKKLDTKIGCLFIDGDKDNFETDFDSYLPHMQDKGVVFMHDIQDDKLNHAVRASWESVVRRGFNTKEIVIKTDSDEAMERAAEGIPPANPHEGWQRFWHGRSCGVGVVYL